MPPPYEILEHTADVGLKIYGHTLPELVINSASGLVALASAQVETPIATAGERLPLKAHGADLEELLVNWLSEVLYFMDAEGWQFTGFHVSDIGVNPAGENTAEGAGMGQRRDSSERSRAIPVKAVTYHQISVRQTSDGWEAVVYFDI